MTHAIHTRQVARWLSVAALCTGVVPLRTSLADEAAVLATAAGAPAAASAAPAAGTTPAGEATRGEGALQEVVVTATRHEESLSKVPISVTALTQDAMDQKGIKDFLDIARFTPGVSIDNSATNQISIRGISSSAGAGTTGIYIDDTPIQMRSVGFNSTSSPTTTSTTRPTSRTTRMGPTTTDRGTAARKARPTTPGCWPCAPASSATS
jgi:outer membrane receptor protein involved in Fe transport